MIYNSVFTNGVLALSCGGSVAEAEAVRGCSGGGVPLDAAVSLLLSDAGLVVLGREQDPRPEPVALDVALHPHEVLDTVGGGPGQDIVSATLM